MSRSGGGPPVSPFADQAFAVAAEAFTSTTSWQVGVRAAVADLFEFLGARPAETEACLADDAREALARRDHTITRFAALLEPGFELAPTPPPPVVAEAVASGIYELVRGLAKERRLEQLPVAAGHATVVALSPFLGSERAFETVEIGRM